MIPEWWGDLARHAYLLTRSTPFGWHCFAPITSDAYTSSWFPKIGLWRCIGCHGIVTGDQLNDGTWKDQIGELCPDFLPALTVNAGPDGQPGTAQDTGKLFF